MLAAALFLLQVQDQITRTPSAYWFPASEGIEKWLPSLAEDYPFDTWIADPKPNAATIGAASKSKIKLMAPKQVYSKANDSWRAATILFSLGKISPAEWIKRTTNLKETFHYLTTPKTPDLYQLTKDQPNGLKARSGCAVFAETLLCYWPGVPCFYATDLYQTRFFPEDPTHESWILAMNDYIGPMMSIRADFPELRTKKPVIVRADSKPGMMIFQQTIKGRKFTFYFNNGLQSLKLPANFNVDQAIIPRGIDLERPDGPYLYGSGTALIVEPPL